MSLRAGWKIIQTDAGSVLTDHLGDFMPKLPIDKIVAQINTVRRAKFLTSSQLASKIFQASSAAPNADLSATFARSADRCSSNRVFPSLNLSIRPCCALIATFLQLTSLA